MMMSKKNIRSYRFIILNLFLSIIIFRSAEAQTEVTKLTVGLSVLKNHIEGVATLSAEQINEQTAIIENNIKHIGQNKTVITEAFNLVRSYDAKEGPLFINARTKSGLSPKTHTGVELDWALFEVQQGILDYIYTPENIELYQALLDGAKFETSKYFPGAVDPPVNPTSSHMAKINCTVPVDWGSPVMYATKPALRPTGCYLAPGSIVTVTVPQSLVNSGYSIRVGAHSWDLEAKPTYKRLNRVSLVYPITNTVTKIGNPLGGGIYIEVPYKANDGVLNIEIANAVRSPFFSAKSFDQTTLDDWLDIERKNPAPWADFESDKFMMQVPSSWIYNYSDPVSLMQNWDKGMDAVSELFGLPLIRNRTVLYMQVDVLMRGNANYPGYPQSNDPYDPTKLENGNKDYHLLKGSQGAKYVVFHELGHACLFTKFSGETEAVVNFLYVAVQNRKFGMSLDKAFGKSYGMEQVSLDQAAIMWMVTENFRNGKPMDISNQPSNEVRYQHRGYAKYVEIARLFGWDALSNFWGSVNQDYMNGITYPTNADPTDSRILRMSKAAGADLTPLIHFWGIQPDDATALKASIAAAGLQPSDSIYNMLKHYQTIIPMNNQEFINHANVIYPNGLKVGQSPLFGVGWYYNWAPLYSEQHGIEAKEALQNIIDLYFPNGPSVITSTGDLNYKNLNSIYPNPASNTLYIRESESIQQVEISGINGILIKSFTLKDQEIDISSLKPGIYFVKLKSNKQSSIQKIIKI